jgi:exopolysaccharide production protein ExoQ
MKGAMSLEIEQARLPPWTARAARRRSRLDLHSVLWLIPVVALLFLQFSQTLAASVFMAVAIGYAAARPGLALRAVFSGLLPWAYVVVAGLSILWSQHTDVSTRAAIQIAITAGAALVMAHALAPRTFMSVWLWALLAADAVVLLNPKTALNAGAMAMIGIFGSKNQMGLSQAILIMVCVWIALDKQRPSALRWLAALSALFAFRLLLSARSVDATAALVGALGCAIVAYNLTWFPRRWRSTVMVGTVLSVGLLFVVTFVYASQLGLLDTLLQASGKDTTLSGRTDLWQRAAKMMQENPILGTGLQAFWVQGNPYAEELWARFAPNRSGYHFHNLWYESGVELGYTGLAIVLATVLLTALQVWRWATRAPSVESCFFLTYVIFICMRTFVEVDLFGQYSFNWVLFIAAWAYARQAGRRGLPPTRTALTRSELRFREAS